MNAMNATNANVFWQALSALSAGHIRRFAPGSFLR